MNKIFSFNRPYSNYTGCMHPCIASALLVASIYAAFRIGSYFFKKDSNSPPDLKDRVQISVTSNQQVITESRWIDEKELMAQYHVDLISQDLTSSVDSSTPENTTPLQEVCLPSPQNGSETRSQLVDIEDPIARPVVQIFEEKDFKSPQSYLKFMHSKILSKFSKILAEPPPHSTNLERRIKGTTRVSLNQTEILPSYIETYLRESGLKKEDIPKTLHLINQGFCADFDDLEPFMSVELDQENMKLHCQRSGLDIKIENQSAHLSFTLFYKVACTHSNKRMRTTVKVETVIKISAADQVTCECSLVRSRGMTV